MHVIFSWGDWPIFWNQVQSQDNHVSESGGEFSLLSFLTWPTPFSTIHMPLVLPLPVSLFLKVYLCVCIGVFVYVFIFVFVCCETLFSTTHTALMPAVPASLSTELQTSWLPHYCFQQYAGLDFYFAFLSFPLSEKIFSWKFIPNDFRHPGWLFWALACRRRLHILQHCLHWFCCWAYRRAVYIHLCTFAKMHICRWHICTTCIGISTTRCTPCIDMSRARLCATHIF